jgi:hypothetical protein
MLSNRDDIGNTPCLYRFIMNDINNMLYTQKSIAPPSDRYTKMMLNNRAYYNVDTAIIMNKHGQAPITMFDSLMYLDYMIESDREDLLKWKDANGRSARDRLMDFEMDSSISSYAMMMYSGLQIYAEYL